MKNIINNKLLLIKYSLIISFNVLTFILCDFYFKSSDTGFAIMLVIDFIINLFIYNYKDKVKYKYYLDIICNFLVGLILLIFIRSEYKYIIVIFSLFLSNNIIFMKSRLSEKLLLRTIEYALIFFLTILSVFISLLLFYLIY